MKSTQKTHTELFRGLCEVLKENSQGLTEEQVKAIDGFLDVLVESLNKRWGKAVKEFLQQQKLANENRKKISDKTAEEKAKPEDDLSKVLEAVQALKQEVLEKETAAKEAAQKELAQFKEASIKATSEALKIEKEKTAAAEARVELARKECGKLEAANEACQKKITELTEQLKGERIKNYLESKLSTLPTYEANLLRKRFSTAQSKEAIDKEFDTALSNVRERRNMASGDFVNGRQRPLNVEPNRFSETAKPAQSRVDLLTETNNQPVSDEDYGDEEGSFVDTPISQEMMARWMSAVG